MFLCDKTNILEGVGIFEVDFAHSHEPANVVGPLIGYNDDPKAKGLADILVTVVKNDKMTK